MFCILNSKYLDVCRHFPFLLPPLLYGCFLCYPGLKLTGFGPCFYAKGHLSLWVVRAALYLCTVLLQPVLNNVVSVFAEDHELREEGNWGQLDGFFCVCDGLVISSQLICLGTEEFEVSFPTLCMPICFSVVHSLSVRTPHHPSNTVIGNAMYLA